MAVSVLATTVTAATAMAMAAVVGMAPMAMAPATMAAVVTAVATMAMAAAMALATLAWEVAMEGQLLLLVAVQGLDQLGLHHPRLLWGGAATAQLARLQLVTGQSRPLIWRWMTMLQRERYQAIVLSMFWLRLA